jgi:hypothetical protein
MLRRIGWILASYFTRPLVVVLIAFGLLLGGSISLVKPRPVWQSNYPGMPRPELAIDSVDSLKEVRREGRQAEVDSINLNYLWAEMHRNRREKGLPADPPGDAFFRVVDEFPNLRSVQLTFYGNRAGSEQVLRLPKLEYLTVDGVVFGKKIDVGWLAQARKLKYLEFSFVQPIEGLDALATLPSLETVVFSNRTEVGDDVLGEAARLPHLKTLVLALAESVGPYEPLTEAGFAALADSKSLRTLYVGSFVREEQTALLAIARRGAPKLNVEPSHSESPTPFSLFGLYPAGMLAAAVGIALSCWFRGPMSRLAPRFAAAHAGVAAAMLLAIVLAATWRLAALDNDPLASLVAICAVVSTTCMTASGGVVEAQMVQRERGRKWLSWTKQLVFFFLLGSLIWPTASAGILRGEVPWMLAAYGFVAVLSIVLMVVSLRGLVDAPAALGPQTRTRGQWQLGWQGQYRPSWMIADSHGGHKIEQLANASGPWSFWKRVERWRAGNPPFRKERLMIVALCGVLPVMWLFMRAFGGQRLGFEALRGQSALMGGMLLFGVSVQVAGIWRTRMLALPLESLRPGERRVWQNEMAAALIVDLAPAILLTAAFEAVALNLGGNWNVAWARVPGDLAWIAACMLPMAVGLAAAMAVVKRDWLAVTLVFATFIGTASAIAGLTVLAADNPLHLLRIGGIRSVLGQLWVPAAVGMVLAAIMYRRWRTLEIGSRA